MSALASFGHLEAEEIEKVDIRKLKVSGARYARPAEAVGRSELDRLVRQQITHAT